MNNRLVAPFAGAAISYLAWTGPEWAGIAALLPLLWYIAPTRLFATLTVFSYYLVGSRSLPESSVGFFGDDHSIIFGVGIWLAAAAINTAPWIVAWKDSPSTLQLALRLLLVVITISIPPVGWIGWLSPWLAASSVIPGLGWGSVLIGLILLLSIPMLWNSGKRSVSLIVLPLLLSVQTLFLSGHPTAPSDWQEIETHWGKSPVQATASEFNRWKMIALEAERQFNTGTRVVIFPEQIAGESGKLAETFIGAYLNPHLNEGKTLLFGSTIADGSLVTNAVSILSDDEVKRYYARQTVPIAMWRPWNAVSYQQSWYGPSTLNVAGKKVAFSACFEDFLFGLALISFIHEQPEIIVSVANAWWANGADEIKVQLLHVKLLASVFNAPLVRAINQPLAK